jgi:mRNA interferase YafQ
MELLDGVVAKLCRGETLDDRFYDHPLGGNYGGCRECHIRNDWILVYEILENDLYLKALQTGTHDDVFGR